MATNVAGNLDVALEVEAPTARLQVIQVDNARKVYEVAQHPDVFWMDFCLTPRRSQTQARFVDHWGAHRYSELGPIVALPPKEPVELKNQPGRHASFVCQLKSAAVERWLPDNFDWTDRRLEACLHVTSERVRSLLLWLYQDLRRHEGGIESLEAMLMLLSIELARFLEGLSEPAEKGGLASWQLRLIDARLSETGEPPLLGELAQLCRISTRQLTRGFRITRGCSIRTHLAELKIETAKRRLATDDPISEIARSLGYATQSSFTFAFRQATDTTPDQYRKSVRSGERAYLRIDGQ